MQNAGKAGVKINISSTLGNVLFTSLVIDEKGRASTVITSNLTETAVISAISPGLNQGFAYLTITKVPTLLAIDKWINDGEPLIAQFSIDQDLEYCLDLSGYGTGEDH
ncbi:MAG: Ig-like domain-containing protein [Candidatus Methanoperedens sp.]|nr:Ig-like domain-containing protein [Candidatus Methanoperedens sp.]